MKIALLGLLLLGGCQSWIDARVDGYLCSAELQAVVRAKDVVEDLGVDADDYSHVWDADADQADRYRAATKLAQDLLLRGVPLAETVHAVLSVAVALAWAYRPAP